MKCESLQTQYTTSQIYEISDTVVTFLLAWMLGTSNKLKANNLQLKRMCEIISEKFFPLKKKKNIYK